MIENGSATANQLRSFLEENKVDLGQLINNLVTTGEVTGRHLDGTEMILVVYPYVVAGGYTVVAKDASTGLYDAHFGLILQQDPPVCKQGYNTRQRDPNSDRGDLPMNEDARCTEPAEPEQRPRCAEHPPPRGPGVPGPGRRVVRSRHGEADTPTRTRAATSPTPAAPPPSWERSPGSGC